MPPEEVNSINVGYTDINDKCYHMFNSWLEKTRNPCWCQVVDAFKMIDLTDIAKHLSDLYSGTVCT